MKITYIVDLSERLKMMPLFFWFVGEKMIDSLVFSSYLL